MKKITKTEQDLWGLGIALGIIAVIGMALAFVGIGISILKGAL